MVKKPKAAATPPGAGRPTSLTPDTQALITQALAACVPVRHACEAAGISYRTFYNWLGRGEVAELIEDPAAIPPDELPYVQFLHATRVARARGLSMAAATLYQLVMEPRTHPAIRLRGLQFILTHQDRENWHPVQHANVSPDDVVVELAWDEEGGL